MKPPNQTNDYSSRACHEAAEWVLRHDRGLTAAEQDNFSNWLAANASHRAAWAEARWGWDELDRLAGLPLSVYAPEDLLPLKPRKASRTRFIFQALFVLAAAVAIGMFFYPRPRPVSAPLSAPVVAVESPRMPLIERRELSDGSVIELNRGAVVTELFSPERRLVRLVRGQAHFTVAKDSSRPFVVEAGGVAAVAVGTAFDVKLDSTNFELVVTEGTVLLARSADGNQPNFSNWPLKRPASAFGAPNSDFPTQPSYAAVTAGEFAVVTLDASGPLTLPVPLPKPEMETRLAWMPRMLDFNNATLSEIVNKFNQHNAVHLTLGDDRLRNVRLSATFRSDNIDGFVRLLANNFGILAEWSDKTGEIVLVQAN
jgi:transmembrane sensor